MLINREKVIAAILAAGYEGSQGEAVVEISDAIEARRALPTVSDGWEDIAETGRMIDLELKRVTSITVGYKRCKGYFVADAGCEPHAYGDTLVDALRASLGPLPAPPSE